MSAAASLRSWLYASLQTPQQAFDFTTFQSGLDVKGPQGRGIGLGLAAPSMRQTGKQHKDTQTSTQGSSAQGSASGYLGPDTLGFLFQLTLLRAHGKAGEQGSRIGE